MNGEFKNTLEGVGEVTVKLQFIRSWTRSIRGASYVQGKTLEQVSEKALKGHPKSHQARYRYTDGRLCATILIGSSLDPPIPSHINWYDWDYLGKAPFVTVRFKYRSLGK